MSFTVFLPVPFETLSAEFQFSHSDKNEYPSLSLENWISSNFLHYSSTQIMFFSLAEIGGNFCHQYSLSTLPIGIGIWPKD
jgi:hypothetical protein